MSGDFRGAPQVYGAPMPTNTSTSSSLDQQHIAIVGASSGIGLAVARSAAARGARVHLFARDAERLHTATAGLEAGRHTLDLNDPDSIQAAFAGIPVLDHVYVAAGSAAFADPLHGDLERDFAKVEERILGSLRVVRAAYPKMRDGGSFVFTGGVSTDRPVKGAWATTLATAAAEQLARQLAVELAPLRFNAVSPGWTDTPMWDVLLGANKAQVFAAQAARFPVPRLARAEEVAEAVLTLMSVRTISGEVLHIDSGSRWI